MHEKGIVLLHLLIFFSFFQELEVRIEYSLFSKKF